MSALWIMVMLGGLGIHLATQARGDRLSVANRLESLRARAGADAGAEHARSRLAAALVDAGTLPPARIDGWRMIDTMFADTMRIGESRYVVRLSDANARLHLNQATAIQLAALLTALRADAGRADRVAQAIADWQDADELRHPRGAERMDYIATGARAIPPNGPIARLDDLLDVRGVDAALLDLIRPHLTLSGSGRINPNTASEPVLATVPAFTPEVTAIILRMRIGHVAISSSAQLLAMMPSGTRNRLADRSAEWMPRVVFDTREIAFESEAWVQGSPVRVIIEGTFVRAGAGMMTVDRRAR